MSTEPNLLSAKGRYLRKEVTGEENPSRAGDSFLGILQEAEDEFAWGMVWARPTLAPRLRAALALVMVAAVGRESDVKECVRICLRQGWSATEIGEILLHMLVYTGICKSRMAFDAAHQVFTELGSELPSSREAQPSADGADPDDKKAEEFFQKKVVAGRRIRGELFGEEFVDNLLGGPDPFMDIFNDVTHAYAFGTIWARGGLDKNTRVLLTLAIAAVTGQHGGIKRHVRSAVTAGISQAEIGEVLLQAYVYGGAPASVGSFNTAKEIFREMRVD